MKDIDRWNYREFYKIKSRLSIYYSKAEKDLRKKMEMDDKKAKKRADKIAKQIRETRDKEEKERLQYEYRRILRNARYDGELYEAMIEDVRNDIHNLNRQAVDTINGYIPEIYAKNYNYEASVIKKIINTEFNEKIAFTLYDKKAIENLASDKIRAKRISKAKDEAWIERQIKNQVAQGIIQGEPYSKIAKRILKVAQRNEKVAVRWARTTTTSALNRGRLDNMRDAQKKGVILKKVWKSVELRGRTRDWHFDLHNKEKDIDKPFENDYGKIMYPGDPNAHPANVENCMCALEEVVKGYIPTLKKGVIEVE